MKIAFISHDASRTGAPILLLNLLSLLKEQTSHELVVLLRKGGPLQREFEKLSKTYLWTAPVSKTRKTRIRQQFAKHFFIQNHTKGVNSAIPEEVIKADVIISNTITNGELLSCLAKKSKGKILSYIHELETSTSRFTSASGAANSISLSEKIAVPSNAVANFLVTKFKVPEARLCRLNYYIPPQGAGTAGEEEQLNSNVTRRLIVGGCGAPARRKGMDIFVATVRHLKSMGVQDRFKFIWKGIAEHTEEHRECVSDIEKAGLDELISFYPSDANMTPFYQNIDLLFLTSREDPYPVVVLEAANFSKPTICFENGGGAPEFVRDDAGKVVGYFDIEAASKALLKYEQHREKIFTDGQTAKARLESMHQDKTLILNQMELLLQD